MGAAAEVYQHVGNLTEGDQAFRYSAMEQAAATYRRTTPHLVATSIIIGCLSGLVSVVLVVLAIKIGIV